MSGIRCYSAVLYGIATEAAVAQADRLRVFNIFLTYERLVFPLHEIASH